MHAIHRLDDPRRSGIQIVKVRLQHAIARLEDALELAVQNRYRCIRRDIGPDRLVLAAAAVDTHRMNLAAIDQLVTANINIDGAFG